MEPSARLRPDGRLLGDLEAKRPASTIDWDKRSLQDFESFPVEELARAYDLIVIDHPHVGQITGEGCLAPLDVAGREAERAALAAASVGKSYPSYTWQGRQWALPIDAATQVQAWRPDLLPAAPRTWNEMLELARQGRVLLPLRPPHSLMTFFTLAANLGQPCASDGSGELIERDTGAAVFEMIREIAALVDAGCLDMDPIAVFERMAASGFADRLRAADLWLCELCDGRISSAPAGLCRHPRGWNARPGRLGAGRHGHRRLGLLRGQGRGDRLRLLDRQRRGPARPLCGGWRPARPCRGVGGRGVNAATGDFYRATRRTLEGAWLRPRHDGYMAFQQAASDRINEGLVGRHEGGACRRGAQPDVPGELRRCSDSASTASALPGRHRRPLTPAARSAWRSPTAACAARRRSPRR